MTFLLLTRTFCSLIHADSYLGRAIATSQSRPCITGVIESIVSITGEGLEFSSVQSYRVGFMSITKFNFKALLYFDFDVVWEC